MIDNKNQKPPESLSFVQQLQNQIQICREAMSNSAIPLTPKVQALESFLWAKLKDDNEYLKTKNELDKWLKERTSNLRDYGVDREKMYALMRMKAREQFKAIMIFIDKRGLMPLGDEYG